jgi:BolA protein
MSRQDQITARLDACFELHHLEVVNESGGHNVPKGSETHFKVVLVSPDFYGLILLARHRLVHDALAEDLAGGVHALAVHTYTDAEWQERFGNAPMSPPCLGASG